MPKKKKSSYSNGKKAKSKAPKQEIVERTTAENDSNDEEDLTAQFNSLLSMEGMMSQMRDQIVSSLGEGGEGYDAQSLQAMDKKLCNYFLDGDNFYYDEGRHTKSDKPAKPTDDEVEQYKQSIIIRTDILRKASGIEATSNSLGGQGHLNLQLYQELYDDIMTYYYAWTEIIFKEDRKELLMACMTISKFVSVKLEQCATGDVDEIHSINQLLDEIKALFINTVEEQDVEGCDDAGYLEYECYLISYRLSIEQAKAGKNDWAEEYFNQAFMAETTWGYFEEENGHCRKVLEFAIGRLLSIEDLHEIDMYAMENDGFYFECLEAYLKDRSGSVSWNRSMTACCNNCGALEVEIGKKLLHCVRCKDALYCGKQCQVEDWKMHKHECNK